MTPMAVKVIWVLTSVWLATASLGPLLLKYYTPDKCREAAIEAVESGGARYAFCTEGYASPLQYLPYPR